MARELLAELGEEPSLEERLMLTRTLGRIGDADAVVTMLELQEGLTDVDLLRPYVRSGLRESLPDVLRADPRGLRAVENGLHGLDGRLLLPVVGALTARPASEPLPVLERVLDRDAEVDRVILRQLAEMDPHSQFQVGDEARALTRRRQDHVDAAVRIQAVGVLWRLGDTDSFEPLVRLLECAEPALARRAHAALIELVGRDMGPDARRWYTWLDAELEWLEREFRSAVARSRGADAGEASAALRELSEHRLLAEDALPVLLRALDHAEPGVVLSACSALRRLDHPGAIPALVSMLGDHRPGGDAAARGALTTLTGETEARTAQAWRAWIER